jgi:3-oxoacyl-[acyl-carrier protein] reductase
MAVQPRRMLMKNQIWDEVLNEAIQAVSADLGTLHRLNPDDEFLYLLAYTEGVFPEDVLGYIKKIPLGKGISGTTSASQKPISTSNLETNAPASAKPRAKELGVKGMVSVPIFSGDNVVGSLGIGCFAEREFTAEEIDQLIEIGRQMAIQRTVVITGASKGIGYATALFLHEKGYHVVGIARNKPLNFPGDFYSTDLSDELATEAVFNTINHQYQVDALVNNAGTAIPAALGQIKINDMSTVLDLNLRPAVQATQILMQGMIERRFGRIVSISSRGALGAATFSTYAASKAALIALAKSWALELATTGVTVNVVAPGPTATESFLAYAPRGSEAEQKSVHKIPMGRLGEPPEIAAAIAFFLSDEASFVTGQTLFVDGGASIGSGSKL